MFDTALPIIRVLCGTKTGQQHWNRPDKYSTMNRWSLPSGYLVADIENNLPVNPSPTAAHTPKHTKLETQTQSVHLRCGGEGDWSSWWQKLTAQPMKRREVESTQPYWSVYGDWVVREIRPECHMAGWHALKINCHNRTANSALIQIFAFKLKVYPLTACWGICISRVVTKVSWNPINPHGRQFENKNSFDIS